MSIPSDICRLAVEMMADYEPGHSDFQVDHFIVGAAGTPFAQYMQCLREIAARVPAVRSLETAVNDSIYARQSVDLDHNEESIQLAIQERKLEHMRTELQRFILHAKALRERIGELTAEKRAALEEQSWIDKCRRGIARDLHVGGCISPGTFDLLIALPPELRRPLLDDAAKTPKQYWFATLTERDSTPPLLKG